MSTAAAIEPTPAPGPTYIPQRLLGVADLAELAHVSDGVIRKWMREDKLPKPLRFGKRLLRWDPNEIAAWLANRR
jgi:predicted DNA-binding transcriptional regulator AlpA